VETYQGAIMIGFLVLPNKDAEIALSYSPIDIWPVLIKMLYRSL